MPKLRAPPAKGKRSHAGVILAAFRAVA